MAINRGKDHSLEKILLINGRYLKDLLSDLELVKKCDANVVVEVNYVEKVIGIHGQLKEQVIIFGPNIDRIVVNERPIAFSRTGEYVSFDGDTRPLLTPPKLRIEEP